MIVKRAASALLGAALMLGSPAFSAETAPSAAPAASSEAAQSAADHILTVMGVRRTLEIIVPSMMAELEQNVATTRPEIRDSLRQTLQSIKPDFDKQALDLYNQAKNQLASMMSEKELVDVSNFFSSPSGQKYLATEPLFLQKFTDLISPWRQQVSTNIVARAREEMKKKGTEF